MRKLFIILSLLGFISSAAASDLYTHSHAKPERSFQIAATWWLPDFQGNQMDKRISNSDNIAGDGDNTCAKYNPSWVTTVGTDMECDAVKPLPNLTCYKNCRCKNVVSVGTGELCNRYCNGNQCVSKSCKPGVSVAAGETCTEKCASNSNICTAKRCAATVSVGTGEQCTATCGGNCVAKSCKAGVSVAAGETCTERCASNSGICTAKSCNATVSVGTGEQCNTTCGGNCVAKSCKGAVSVGTGEQCTQRCASNSGVCTAKSCKSTATVNTGEYCTERCASNNSCTAKACKSAVSIGTGETCTERCYSNSNICTAKTCQSGFEFKNGVCVSAKTPCEIKIDQVASSLASGSYSIDPGEVTMNETVFITKDFNISGRIGSGVSKLTIKSFEECKTNGKLPTVSGRTQSTGSNYDLTLDTVRADNLEVNKINNFTVQNVPFIYGANAAQNTTLLSSCQTESCGMQLNGTSISTLSQSESTMTYDFSLVDNLSIENVNLQGRGKNNLKIFSEYSSNTLQIMSLNFDYTTESSVDFLSGKINISGLNLSSPNMDTATVNSTAYLTIETISNDNATDLNFIQGDTGTTIIRNIYGYDSTYDFKTEDGGCLKIGYIDSNTGLEMGYLSFINSKVKASNLSQDVCAFPFFNVFIASQSPQYVTSIDGDSDYMGTNLMPQISGSSFSIFGSETCASSSCVPTNYASGDSGGDSGENTCPDPDSFYDAYCPANGGTVTCSNSSGTQSENAEQTSPNCWKCDWRLSTHDCFMPDLNDCNYHEGLGRRVVQVPDSGFSCAGYWYPCQRYYSDGYYVCIPGDQPPYGNSCESNGFGDDLNDFWECDPNGNSNIVKDYCLDGGSKHYRCYCPSGWSCRGYGGYNPPF